MHNVPKWSDTLLKFLNFKVCPTILGHCAFKGEISIKQNDTHQVNQFSNLPNETLDLFAEC